MSVVLLVRTIAFLVLGVGVGRLLRKDPYTAAALLALVVITMLHGCR